MHQGALPLLPCSRGQAAACASVDADGRRAAGGGRGASVGEFWPAHPAHLRAAARHAGDPRRPVWRRGLPGGACAGPAHRLQRRVRAAVHPPAHRRGAPDAAEAGPRLRGPAPDGRHRVCRGRRRDEEGVVRCHLGHVRQLGGRRGRAPSAHAEPDRQQGVGGREGRRPRRRERRRAGRSACAVAQPLAGLQGVRGRKGRDAPSARAGAPTNPIASHQPSAATARLLGPAAA